MGRTPRRGERQERHDRRDPGNTGPPGTDSLGAQILEAVRPIRSPSWQVVDGSLRTRQGGQVASRDATRYRGGEPSEDESPRALPARNKAGEVAGGARRQEAEKA